MSDQYLPNDEPIGYLALWFPDGRQEIHTLYTGWKVFRSAVWGLIAYHPHKWENQEFIQLGFRPYCTDDLFEYDGHCIRFDGRDEFLHRRGVRCRTFFEHGDAKRWLARLTFRPKPKRRAKRVYCS